MTRSNRKKLPSLHVEALEDRTVPTAEVSIAPVPYDPTAEEGGTSAYFALHRTGSTSEALPVYLDQGSIGMFPYQYTLTVDAFGTITPGMPVSMGMGISDLTITMTAVDDLVPEETLDPTIALLLPLDGSYNLGTPDSAVFHIIDNDGLPPGDGSTIVVGDRVWLDMSENGSQEAAEAGIPDVTVELLDNSGSVLQTVQTNLTGNYAFSVQSGEQYQIRVNLPYGYCTTLQLVGDPALDSDVDWDGVTDLFTVGAASDLTLDAGLVYIEDPANNAPFHIYPELQVTGMNTPLLYSDESGNPIWIGDYDANGEEVEVTIEIGGASLEGASLTLGSLDELTFLVGDGTTDEEMTFRGTLLDINEALQGLTYLPPPLYSGPAGFWLTTNDLGNTGTGGPSQSSTLVELFVGSTYRVRSPDPFAYESGADTGEIVIELPGPSPSGLEMYFTFGFSGMAEYGVDYWAEANGITMPELGILTLPAGTTEYRIIVHPILDAIADDEEFSFAITAPLGLASPLGTMVIMQIKDEPFGLNKTKLPAGNNHAAAHLFSTGAGAKVGVIESTGPANDELGIIAEKSHLGERLKHNKDYRPVEDFGGQPKVIAQKFADGLHGTLVADIIAGGHQKFKGVAPEALVYAAYVSHSWSIRSAMSRLYTSENVAIFNASHRDTHIKGVPSGFYDWHAFARDTLFVVAAGNSAADNDKFGISSPGNAYNLLTVGAVGADFKTRAFYSDYVALDDRQKMVDTRSLPHILAPGGEPLKKLSNGIIEEDGTSFAAPHVTGIAALLAERGGVALKLGIPGNTNHLAYKAIILNSARKRLINGPENGHLNARDNDATKTESADKDYLTTVDGKPAIADHATAGKTAEWSPTDWDRKEIVGKAFKKLIVIKPLDDEQGTGVADAERAMLQHDGGKKSPGAESKSVSVGKKGWSVEKLKQYDETTREGLHNYVLNHAIAKGDMITATLVWDKLVKEKGLQNGIVEEKDQYIDAVNNSTEDSIPSFSLMIQYDDGLAGGFETVAMTSYKDDPVQHLHFPAPVDGAAGKYRIVVRMDVTATQGATHDYSLAWWTK